MVTDTQIFVESMNKLIYKKPYMYAKLKYYLTLFQFFKCILKN